MDPRTWLSTGHEFIGQADVTLQGSDESLCGIATVTVSVSGELAVDFAAQDFGPGGFFHAMKLVHDLGALDLQRRCKSLTIQCPNETLVSERESDFLFSGSVSGGKASLRLYPTMLDLRPLSAPTPRYWVVPLTNFYSKYRTYSDRKSHPIAALLPPSRDSQVYDDDDHCEGIFFEFRDQLGMIFPVVPFSNESHSGSDVEEPKITAMMIGEMETREFALDDVPWDYLLLLSVITGASVGAPWVELRAANGELVRRLYARSARNWTGRARPPIDEIVHGGTGHLLTLAAKSRHWNKKYFRLFLSNLARGAATWLLDDQIGHLARALDSLIGEWKLSVYELLDIVPLEAAEEVREIVSHAGREITQLARRLRRQGDSLAADRLKRVADRVYSAVGRERIFGESVVALLQKFDFPDADVLEAHYLANPRVDGLRWSQVVSTYRGSALHAAGFPEVAGQLDVQDVKRVSQHLLDIGYRILLRMTNYDGTYQPAVQPWACYVDVDWVTSNTPVQELGY